MWMLLLTVALAGAPTSWIGADGVVTGTVSLPATPASVLALVSDPVAVNTVNGGNTRVKVTAREGACAVLDYVSPSIFSDVHYKVRQCPVPGGTESVLVESDSFSKYRARWTLAPEGTGTLLRYDLDVAVTMMVPASFVEVTLKREVRQLMERMVTHFTPTP